MVSFDDVSIYHTIHTVVKKYIKYCMISQVLSPEFTTSNMVIFLATFALKRILVHNFVKSYLACSRSRLFPKRVTAAQPGRRDRSSNDSSSAAARKDRRSHTEYTTANASPHRTCSARHPRIYTKESVYCLIKRRYVSLTFPAVYSH